MPKAPLRSSTIESAAASWSAGEAVELALPDVQVMLAEGGDFRLALDPITGRSRYGCSATPDPGPADFGSATASAISSQGFDAAGALHCRLEEADGREPRSVTYARELQRLRGDLIGLCGLRDVSGLDVVFAASGTDLHLIVAELVSGPAAAPTVCINTEPEETGSGVPAALGGRHFSGWTALGAPVCDGAAIGPGGTKVVAVSARAGDGRLRPASEVEAELNAVAKAAVDAGGKVLLTLADSSKTGLISPGLEAVLALRERFGDQVEVMVDACQFRLAPRTLQAYLDQGFLVAVTGSKFLTGPTFSGALLVPGAVAERLRARLPRPGLRPYSARAEWPASWVASAALTDAANYGLLLRWEAAMSELRAFRAHPGAAIEAAARVFAEAVQARLDRDPCFEPLDTRLLDRSALGVDQGWDAVPTIFPFLLRHDRSTHDGLLSQAAHQDAYRGLMGGRVRLGQPVACGVRDGRPISALRLCNSTRLITECTAGNTAVVIERAMSALDAAAQAADTIYEEPRSIGVSRPVQRYG
jgi:hypothetical protein